jgi:EAL domain-containing protein (putative c-di-GMP-specific phosphodiesterase class I)
VDDFGTGNASIEYLAKLPATEIKINRRFITTGSATPKLTRV